MRKIKAVILDWAGTLVDYGCMASEENYREIFAEFNINLTKKEIRNKMGIKKLDHIRYILESDRVSKLWFKNTGIEANEGDVRELNRRFESKIFEKVEKHSEPKEYVIRTLEILRESGIRIGSTTSYSSDVMEFLTKISKQKGLYVDYWANSEQVNGQGRPNPFMIFKNMEKMGIGSVQNVIKVGDTINDIKEGINAGVTTVAIVDGSSEMGLSLAEFESLDENEQNKARLEVRNKFKKAGADYIVNNFSSIPYLIAQIENKN